MLCDMAWLYKRGGKWWIGYRHNGKQVLASTKTNDKAQAETELHKVEVMFEAHKHCTLTDDLYRALTGNGIPAVTLAAEMDGWLAETEHSTATNTHDSYTAIAEEFKTFLGATDKGPMLSTVTSADVGKYLMQKRKTTAASTTNKLRKILSAFFKRAVAGNRLRENPVTPIKPFKAQKGERVKRRAFTLDELSAIYSKAPDSFWKYMVQGEFYTGLRMGDLICLRVGVIDLEHGILRLEDEKTEKPMFIPLAKPFRALLAAVMKKRGKCKPSDFLWPEQAKRHQSYKSGSGYFSNQFYNLILAPCGLVPKRLSSHKSKKGGEGRGVKRQTNEVSFHCLRHSFISFLRSTGANQAVAKELAGHSSDQVNALYTHVPEQDLTAAIGKLPEFVK